MSGPYVTWMPVPAPQGYLVTPYKQGDTMTESSDYESIQVFIGVDTGKAPITPLPLIVQVNVCSTEHYPTTKTNSEH